MTPMNKDQNQKLIEKNGESFSLAKLIYAQDLTKKAIEEISFQIRAGMTENEALQIAKTVFTDMGFEKHWHTPKVRFGTNTTKSFSELSEPNIQLKETDIYFLDFGAVFDNHESDFGSTFILKKENSNYTTDELMYLEKLENLIHNSKVLFHEMKTEWKTKSLTGQELYEFACKQAKKKGYTFKLEGASGHRIGDFPHHVHFKGHIADLNFKPQEHVWILEVQIIDPSINCGAFFEDIL